VNLAPGTYAFQVQAISAGGMFSDSGYTVPLSFTVAPCNVCTAPSVTLTSVDPSTLWPPNNQMTAVTIKGSVTSSCPLSSVKLTVRNGSQVLQDVTVFPSSDGSFTVTTSLQASKGRRYELTVAAQNELGSALSNPMFVVVPHDQGKRGD
jgi:hypothetical protein